MIRSTTGSRPEIRDGSLFIDGQRQLLLGGETHNSSSSTVAAIHEALRSSPSARRHLRLVADRLGGHFGVDSFLGDDDSLPMRDAYRILTAVGETLRLASTARTRRAPSQLLAGRHSERNSMTTISANMEWLFTEGHATTAERIRAAAAHGLNAVEIWGWREKNVPAIRAALDETGVRLLSLVVDPQLQIADTASHNEYLAGVRESIEVAIALEAPYLVVVAGDELPEVPRDDQHAAVVAVLSQAAELLAETDITLLLEPLNTKLDHVGSYLSSTEEGLDIVREVDSPHLRLLLDAYHALMMNEDLAKVIGDDVELVGHVQVADLPGRGEPGSGSVDWEHQLSLLRALGYRGYWGLEYLPRTTTAQSLEVIQEIAARVG